MDIALRRPLAPTGSLLAIGVGVAVIWLELPAAAALFAGALVAVICERAGVSAPAWGTDVGQRLLKIGVVALGAGLELGFVLRAGLDGLGATALTLALALTLGAWLTRRAGLATDVGALVTVGTAICGGSAIAAAAPALRAKGEDVGVALGVVLALNALALVVFPFVGTALGLEAEAFGRWCALAIHDTSSVVGAATVFGPEALETATVTKLARALWIVPVVAGLSFWHSRRHGSAAGSARRIFVPGFILAFVAAAALVTLVPALAPAGERIAVAGRWILVAALYALGLGTRMSALRRAGPRALGAGAILWVALAVASLALVAL